ncbi:YHS domain-containing protein [Streptomyces sp. ActVer]|uniref:YHS domain-containing protein n=1 Tax=Streptomyces sp. ActVer TaxID=3014558 RepID=UPI0022B31149|nr:YHS domain-containing protein [Streptomyces sp. ActVer]MCZ4508734.1 YHS domain-containing protein [Streptomyces sp. ActVer]
MATKATDPVCGMMVEESPTTPRISYQGRTYLFCSDACKARFTADPDRYTENQ